MEQDQQPLHIKAVIDAIIKLLKAAAAYIQTATFHKHCEKNFNDKNMQVALVLYNNVKDSNIRGRHAKGQALHTKPITTLMSSRREAIKDLCYVLNKYIKKKKNQDEDFGIEWDILLSDDSYNPNYLVDTIVQREKDLTEARSVPKSGVRTSQETEDQIPENFGTLVELQPSTPQTTQK